jgi:hypothetical protein|tara:strand:+ start:7557 stop:8030 length:474 start_codon:yes stop_codon:yes gene_type:complete
MPTYRHSSGAVTAAKRVTATDVFTQNDDGAIIEVSQPAGTILSEVIVRFTNTSTHAASSQVGYELGVATSAATLGTDIDGFLDSGTSIPENTVYFLRTGQGAVAAGAILESVADSTPAAALGYTDTERSLYLTFLHSNHEVTVNSNVEVNFLFTHLN